MLNIIPVWPRQAPAGPLIVPAGATITNNIGTSITVSFGAFVSGSVCARANSKCGSSAYKCLAVTGAGPNISSTFTEKTSDVAIQLFKNSTVEQLQSSESISALKVFPNPSSGNTTITFNAKKNVDYIFKVVNMIGKIIINERISAVEGFNTKEIDLKNASNGLYIITVQTGDGEYKTLHLIVE